MGCDIHLVLEKKFDGKWVGIDTFVGHEQTCAKGWAFPVARSRNYVRFAALAGVRGEGPAALGVPEDASDTARCTVAYWGEDGHSHSWLPLKEAAQVFLATSQLKPDDYGFKYPASYFFSVDESDDRILMDDYRVVFWFDN